MTNQVLTTGRYIGIRHRVKQTTTGEARPTQLTIIAADGTAVTYELAEEVDEFDFLHGEFPTEFRSLAATDDLSRFRAHHIKWRTLRAGESADALNPQHLRQHLGKTQIAAQVPQRYAGPLPGDKMAMIFGGSGDYFAYALSRKGKEVGASIHRIPPFALKAERERDDKTEDATLLATLCRDQPGLFFEVLDPDIALIRLRMAADQRRQAQRDRIACGNRVNRLTVGAIFCNDNGLYPEGGYINAVDATKANSTVLKALVAEEKRMDQQLKLAAEATTVYTRLLKPLDGMGPAIASPIIAGIGDIRRFATASKLKAYCGVHLLPDGTFPRRRGGTQANWSGAVRQALYLFGDQCVKRPDSKWGIYLRRMKANLRAKHPEVIEVDGKKRYTDGHIHRMGIWRTLTRFIEWLFREWWELAKNPKYVPIVRADTQPTALPTANENAADTSASPSDGATAALDKAAD
jgi:transposase